ncbi:MAG: hypothetical protein AAE977_06070 [Thermoplasmataceae archaeon]|jgi:hypothetical protein
MKLKTKSKESQKEFVRNLKSLYEDPLRIIPDCIEKGFMCHFEGYKKKLEKISESGDFDKYDKSSDQFLRGIAESHRILENESVPLMGFVSTPYGKVEYARRGEADESVLAGIQNYDDDIWRMLAFSSIIKTRNVKLFSSQNFYLATCKGNAPPREFYEDVLKEEGIGYSLKDDIICIGSTGDHFEIRHLAGPPLYVFEDSVYNTIFRIIKHVLAKDVIHDFSLKYDYLQEYTSKIPDDIFYKYFDGRVDDRTFLRSLRIFRMDEAAKKGVFFVAGKPYKSVDELMALFPELKDLSSVRNGISSMGKGIIMDDPSERKILEILWNSHSNEILQEMFPGSKPEDYRSLKGNPMEQIQTMRNRLRSLEVDEKVVIRPWSDNSRYLIETVMAFYKKGADFAKKFGESEAITPIKKSIFCALLIAIDGTIGNREWMFSKDEKALGIQISTLLSELLKTPEKSAEIADMLKAYIP